MSFHRRDFLRCSSLGVAAGLLATSGAHATELLEAPRGGRELDVHARRPTRAARQERVQGDWEAVRARFAIDRSYVHMAGLLLASHPEPVARAIEEYRVQLDANPVPALGTDGESLVRQAVVRYCGAPPAEVALTTSTTMGLALAIHGLRVAPGEELLHTTHDHPVMGSAIEYKAAHSGVSVRRVSLYDEERSEQAEETQVLERLRAAIRPETRLFGATWVHSKKGVKLPVAAMSHVIDEMNAQRAPEERVVFVVDGVHGFGVEDVDVPALGCDFFAAGTHKWIFGPRGTGILWGNPRSHARATPIIPTMSHGQTWGDRMSPGGFQAFEHRWAAARAFDFHREIGRPRIAARIAELAGALKEGLRAMPHVRVYTPASLAMSSGIVCFDVRGVEPREVVRRLLDEHRIIASTTPYTPTHARLAPGLLNDPSEVEKCLEAVRGIA